MRIDGHGDLLLVFYSEGSYIFLGLRVLVLLLGGGGVVVAGAGAGISSGVRASSTSSSICGLASSSWISVVSGEFADFSNRLPRTYCLPWISMT